MLKSFKVVMAPYMMADWQNYFFRTEISRKICDKQWTQNLIHAVLRIFCDFSKGHNVSTEAWKGSITYPCNDGQNTHWQANSVHPLLSPPNMRTALQLEIDEKRAPVFGKAWKTVAWISKAFLKTAWAKTIWGWFSCRSATELELWHFSAKLVRNHLMRSSSYVARVQAYTKGRLQKRG